MKKLLFALLISAGFCSAIRAQVFDHIVNYPLNTNYPGLDYQPRVMSLSAGNKIYTLSHEIPHAGAVITEYDPNGNVTQAARRIHEMNSNLVVYTSMCFNVGETELVLVGTVFGGTASEVIITRYDLGSSTVTGSVSIESGSASTWLEGVAIRSYQDVNTGDSRYLVGGTHRSCYNGCANMFLAHLDGGLGVIWSGYFTSNSAKDFLFRDMTLNTAMDEVTLMGFKDDVEVVFFKFDYANHQISSSFLGGNVKSLIYPVILETPPHMLFEPSVFGNNYYFGAGISDDQGQIHVLLAKTDDNINLTWSNGYDDGSAGGPSAQIWSPGRLVLSDDFLITSFQTANNALPDNGIIRVDKSNGLFVSAISYNNWMLGALYPVNTNLGSETMMTTEAYQWTRIFDGDAFGTNNIGCGNYSREIHRFPAQPNIDYYNFTANSVGPTGGPSMTSSIVNGSYTDCSGTPIGTYKKAPTSIDDEVNATTASLYPNPSQGQFVLDLGDEDIEAIEVLDYMGRILFQVPVTGAKIEVDVSTQEKGVYLIKLVGKEKSNTLPFYKE